MGAFKAARSGFPALRDRAASGARARAGRRRLLELPATRAAFARGELSYSQVRAVTRIADSEQEEVLVGLARHASAAQLERLVRAYRGAVSLESAREAHERRFVDWRWEDDGSLSLRARLSAEEGALLLQALAAGRDGLRQQATVEHEEVSAPVDAAEAPETGPPSNADALVAMADALLSQGGAVRSSADRYQVVVHADAEALAGVAASQADDGQPAPARCELEEGPPICPETARRLACDAALVKLVEKGGRPISVGRLTRSIPPALRRALRSRDPGCRFPGCGNQSWLDAHHIHHWARGGATALDNLVHLCRHHHRLLHEGGFSVARRAGGSLAFCRPDGTRVPASPARPRGRASALPTRNRQVGIDVTHSTLVPLSAGERMDLGLAVSGLLEPTRKLTLTA